MEWQRQSVFHCRHHMANAHQEETLGSLQNPVHISIISQTAKAFDGPIHHVAWIRMRQPLSGSDSKGVGTYVLHYEAY